MSQSETVQNLMNVTYPFKSTIEYAVGKHCGRVTIMFMTPCWWCQILYMLNYFIGGTSALIDQFTVSAVNRY